MKNLHSSSPVSTLQVLDVLSDRTSIDILNAVAENVTNSGKIKELLSLTHKQYYHRYSRLLKTGIIKRKNSQLTLTSFGQLIYHALLKIATAFGYSHELTMIDAIKSAARMPHNEQKDLIDKLILDDEIRKLFP
jgi:DNA-binding HxlR family transcriptional regulator